MKTKIVGIFVCMLMIATAIPAVTSLKNSTTNAAVPSHPRTSMAGSWTETQKLLASDGGSNDAFGGWTVISGDTAIVSAPQHSHNGHYSGSAYVFTRTGSTWTEQTELLPSDGVAEDQFSYCTALDGNTAIVTSLLDDDNGVDSGSAYVFVRAGTTWTQQAKLLPLDGGAGDHFGFYCALDGDTAVIGANWDSDNGNMSGSAYVFTRIGTTWTQQAKLLASDGQAGDRFGGSIAVTGDTALIGAYYDDDNGVDSGSMYVFTRTGTTWTEQQKFHPSDAGAGDTFGGVVSLSGDSVLIGAGGDNDMGSNAGAAYVFVRNGANWTQQAKLHASDGAAGDEFGIWGLSLDGDTALIGSFNDDDHGSNSGSSYVFTRTGTTWTQQQKLLATDGAAGDNFGGWGAISGDSALIGAPTDDDNGMNSGSEYVFTKVGLTFSIVGGLGVNLKITNNGTANASGVLWQIHVQGGILGRINRTVNSTIDIPAGVSKKVGTGILFGLGPLAITANVADEQKTATGTQIIVLSMVKK